MSTATLEKVEELRTTISNGLDAESQSLARMNYRLSDAIREGSTVSGQKVGGWGDGQKACALHAAVIAARARGYLE